MVASFRSSLAGTGASLFGSASDLNSDQVGQPYTSRVVDYRIAEHYYANTAYERWNDGFAQLKARGGLYALTTGIYNPFGRAVDWYSGAVYPGAFTDDGSSRPDGTPCCVPFGSGVDEGLRRAAMAMLGWTNWESDRYVYVGSLAMLGDAFGEIEIDYDRGKSYPRLHHPKYVTDLEWNATGDVVKYRLEIPQVDRDGRSTYTWGKVVDRETITYLKDGKPYHYDGQDAATIENPFGFVPAVWVQFRNRGGQHGRGLMAGIRGKLDRLNSSASSIHDYIGKFAAQGVVLKTDAKLNGAVMLLTRNLEEWSPSARDDIRYLKGPKDLDIDRLIQNLGLGEAEPYLKGLIGEIEADLPEATIDDRVRELGAASGVALRLMFGSTQKRLFEVEGNADAGLRKFIQMGVAIQGHLTDRGTFGAPRTLTEIQRLFLPFGLDSYARGDLNVSFVPRPLFPDTPMERVQLAQAIEALQTPYGLELAGVPPDVIWGEDNVPAAMPGLIDQQQNAARARDLAQSRAFNGGV